MPVSKQLCQQIGKFGLIMLSFILLCKFWFEYIVGYIAIKSVFLICAYANTNMNINVNNDILSYISIVIFMTTLRYITFLPYIGQFVNALSILLCIMCMHDKITRDNISKLIGDIFKKFVSSFGSYLNIAEQLHFNLYQLICNRFRKVDIS